MQVFVFLISSALIGGDRETHFIWQTKFTCFQYNVAWRVADNRCSCLWHLNSPSQIWCFRLSQLPSVLTWKCMYGMLDSTMMRSSYCWSVSPRSKVRRSSPGICASCVKVCTCFLRPVKYLRLSSEMCGSCSRGDLNSHRACTIMGDSFIQFSMVSIDGRRGTDNKFNS